MYGRHSSYIAFMTWYFKIPSEYLKANVMFMIDVIKITVFLVMCVLRCVITFVGYMSGSKTSFN